MNKNCEYCKKEFKVKKSEFDRRKTCSKDCMMNLRKKNGNVKLKCKTCNKDIVKTKSQLKKTKNGNHFCGLECLGKYNSKKNTQNIIKSCIVCNEEFKTIKSREKTNICCSIKCQGLWQSQSRIKEKSGNFKGGTITKTCHECHSKYETRNRGENDNRKFCSKKCKNENWKREVLLSEDFSRKRYEGNLKRIQEKKETLPEKMVREYLEGNNIEFIQEQGFFGRYFADFYIPSKKIIIEVQGDFWHGNPLIYGEDKIPLNKHQIERMEKDIIKKNDFLKYGFTYFEIWENDIYNDVEKEMKKII